ncbi:MAG: bifunctional nuclease family protein [Chloroflexi bacterium]|nr:bifunctional nuclease family protein [Chloroflexota bacterium]
MIEMTVDSIRVSLVNYQRVVILKQKDADRLLPIWIGSNEADAIAIRLQNVAVARPLTHDLLKSAIEQLGGKVQHILVNDLSDDVFYARIVLDVNGRQEEVDSRPSDAIALAVRCDAKIYVAASVLERAGVTPEADKEPDEHAAEGLSQTKDDEIKKLAAFRDFINTLDLDSLGPGEGGKS